MPDGASAAGRAPGVEEGVRAVGERVRSCQLCRLCTERHGALAGDGCVNARVMIVTERPGYHEDRAGEAFVGAAGELLDSLLADVSLTRDDVWITSIVKCRTPRNRTPFPDEIETCEGYLFHEMALVRPRIVCAMSSSVIRVLTGRPARLEREHGTPITLNFRGTETIVLPLYHPGAVVQVPTLLPQMRADMRQIPRLLRGDAAASAAPVVVEEIQMEAVDLEPGQLTMQLPMS